MKSGKIMKVSLDLQLARQLRDPDVCVAEEKSPSFPLSHIADEDPLIRHSVFGSTCLAFCIGYSVYPAVCPCPTFADI